jgi:hypothetical protein
MAALHFWVILGDKDVRKGSLIRALTGIGQERRCDILLANGQSMRLWAAVMSVNEAKQLKTPKVWVASCRPPAVSGHPAFTHNRENILVAFRFDIGKVSYAAENYLNEMSRVGARIESIVTLGERTPGWVPEYGVPYAHILDIDVPTAHIAEQVRQFWGWR